MRFLIVICLGICSSCFGQTGEVNRSTKSIKITSLFQANDTARNIRLICVKPSTKKLRQSSRQHPLYVIDGTIIRRKKIKGIDPASIEKVEILKDKKAIESYGVRGKYGVIIITKKRSLRSTN